MPNFSDDPSPSADALPAKPDHYLREWRQAARPKITAEKMAEALGVSKSTMSEYESGKYNVSVKQLRKAADFLRVPLGYLIEYHPDQVNPDVMEAWGKIRDEDKPKALGMLKVLGTI